jgi:hypothetical protein
MALTSITKDFITKAGIVVHGTSVVTSSTQQTGALQVNSGAAIAKNLVVGTTADVYGAVTLHDLLTVSGATQINNTLNVLNTATFQSNASVGGALGVTGATTLSSTLAVTGDTTLTGALTANGGATFNGNLSVSGAHTLSVGTGATTLGGTLSVAGATSLTDSTMADASGAGALKVTGGAYIGGNIVVADTTDSTATSIGSIITAGGVGIAKNLNVGGNTVIGGNLTVLGVQTIINSTSTNVTDPVIDLGTAPNGAELSSDDGLNKGLVIHYYDTVANNASHMFVGRSDSGSTFGRFVFRDQITTKDNADYVNNGAFAGVDVGSLIVHNTTDATGTGTGAFQVDGGVSVTKKLYVGDAISGANVTARNLTAGRITFAGTGGELVDDSALTYNAGTGVLTGTISQAQKSQNLNGGATGSLPYQSSADTTTFLSIGNQSDILSVDANGLPYWKSVSSIAIARATTATNIDAGGSGQVPYNSAYGITSFDSNFTYASSLLTVPTANISSITDSTTSTNGALTVAGGAGIAKNLNVGGTVSIAGDLNVDGTIYLKGVGLDTITSTTGTFVNVHINGAGTSLVVDNNATITGTATIGVANVTSGSVTNNWQAGSLTVLGTSNLQTTNVSSLTSTGTVAANSLSVTNNATVGGTFGVTGTTTLTGAVTAQAGLTVSSGDTSLVNLTAAATTVTSLTVSGSSTLAGVSATSLTVGTGQTTVAGLSAAATTATSLNVTGNASVGGTFAATGVASFAAAVKANSTDDSINNASTGSVVVAGGVGVAKSMTVGGSIYVGTATAAPGTTVAALYSNDVVLASYTSNVISGTSLVSLDAFDATAYRSARYTVQIVDGSDVHMTEIMVFHDGVHAYINEYGIAFNNSELGAFDANLTSGSLTMTFTPVGATAMTIKVVRMTLTA